MALRLQIFIFCNESSFCLYAATGKLAWKFAAEKGIFASPVIKNMVVCLGASDGHFRAINLASGKLLWNFNEVTGFVVTDR
ncbi:MAG: PQQ-binding-like beta-propeller repeat protein [Mucilaginibacter sp.]